MSALRHFLRTAAAATLFLCVTSCGGGGGGAPAVDVAPTTSDTVVRADPPAADDDISFKNDLAVQDALSQARRYINHSDPGRAVEIRYESRSARGAVDFA